MSNLRINLRKSIVILISVLAFLVARKAQHTQPADTTQRETALDTENIRNYGQSRFEYAAQMKALEGTPYSVMNCFTFVCLAHASPVCPSNEMWANGCGGRLQHVSSFSNAAMLATLEDTLKPGDVAVFLGGGHVAAYLGNHLWVDSTHRGVTEFKLLDRAPFDYWYNGYKGEIKVLRWSDIQY